VVGEGDLLRLPENDIGYLGGYSIIPRGTELKVRTNESIDSRTASPGQRFSAVMEEDVRDSNGTVIVTRHSDTELVIRSTAGNDLVLDIDSLTVAGNRYYVSTEDMERRGRSGLGANKRTAVLVGGGAVGGRHHRIHSRRRQRRRHWSRCRRWRGRPRPDPDRRQGGPRSSGNRSNVSPRPGPAAQYVELLGSVQIIFNGRLS
jgi:hypothetical protein